MIDVATQADRNVTQKKTEKKKKTQKRLCVDIERMWSMKSMIIQVTILSTGIVTQGLKKHLQAIPGKHSVDSLQKTAVLGTSPVMRKVLQSET